MKFYYPNNSGIPMIFILSVLRLTVAIATYINFVEEPNWLAGYDSI